MARLLPTPPERVLLGNRISRLFRSLLPILGALALASANPAYGAQRGPDVVVIAEEDQMIYEFRQNGQLRMIRVVPSFGKPYYLIPRDPTKGDGDLQRVESLVPSWVLWEFE